MADETGSTLSRTLRQFREFALKGNVVVFYFSVIIVWYF